MRVFQFLDKFKDFERAAHDRLRELGFTVSVDADGRCTVAKDGTERAFSLSHYACFDGDPVRIAEDFAAKRREA